MSTELTPLLTAAVIFGWGGGIVFTAIGVYLSIRHRRLHPFLLGSAGYYGWNDWVYGQWVGDLKVEGNHVTDCDKPENAQELHQLRDLLVRVEEPIGGGVGLGNAETFALGAFPERRLTVENSFL
jgi:hypothetical protein